MKQSWECRQQDTSQQWPQLDKRWRSKLLTLSPLFLVALLVISSCNSGERQDQTKSTNQPTQAGTPDPEVERQKQKVAEISARCEAIRKEAADTLRQSVVCCAPVKSSYDGGGAFFKVTMENLNRSRRKKSEALKQKADGLMENFKTCEGELRTLAQSDNAEVRNEANLALKTLEEKLNEQNKDKGSKAASSKK